MKWEEAAKNGRFRDRFDDNDLGAREQVSVESWRSSGWMERAGSVARWEWMDDGHTELGRGTNDATGRLHTRSRTRAHFAVMANSTCTILPETPSPHTGVSSYLVIANTSQQR